MRDDIAMTLEQWKVKINTYLPDIDLSDDDAEEIFNLMDFDQAGEITGRNFKVTMMALATTELRAARGRKSMYRSSLGGTQADREVGIR